jgi:segregation and condensation protein B
MLEAQIKQILEAAILVADEPVSVERLAELFDPAEGLNSKALRVVLGELAVDYKTRGIELKEVASGYRFQAKEEVTPWLARWLQDRPGRYSRAFLETLALIAYRGPVTRAEIEEIRGVSISSGTLRGLLEREWVKVVGHKEAPGKPALYATTKQFLDYFNLKSLAELPSLKEINESPLPQAGEE